MNGTELNMFTVYKKQLDWHGRQLTIETGKIARQADASVMVTLGETVVMANVCFQKQANEAFDFFPLMSLVVLFSTELPNAIF